ncbi:MAG TPA: FAD-dependent oxidoreductase, partial [Chitinophagaceae bacterium]|nr:FAD-dependent oxidoreductase [Chitinophagaceae bacterium]
MLRVCLLLLGLGMLGGASAQDTSRILRTDVLVIGGGTGGTAAAIQCARRQVQTVLVEPTRMLGGMLSAAGVSCTDGNDELPSGMWEEFRQALYRHYGTRELNTGWVSNTCFEPHVADSIFKAWAAREKSLTVLYGYRFEQVLMEGSRVQGALFRAGNGSSLRIEARLVIDATELGDVLAGAGADYDLGMEDPAQTGESQAPGTYPIIQDITWTAIVRLDGRGPAKGIRRPADYDERRYYCCNTDAPCQGKPWNGNTAKMLAYGKLPNNKYMINWPFHGNDYYLNVVEGHEAERRAGYEKARDQTRGFLYFLQTRLGLKKLRLATDELDGGLALIPYNREGRRVRGVVRFNLNHILRPFDYTLFRTGVAVGDYPVDHHHGQYPGKVPAIDFPPVPSYNL